MKIKYLLLVIVLLAFCTCTPMQDLPDNPPPVNGGNSGGGQTSTDAVYTVTQALNAYESGQSGCITVKGYIVGAINGKNIAEFESTTEKSNILIADKPDERVADSCLVLLLAFDSDAYTALNLADNHANYGKMLEVTGNLDTFEGLACLNNIVTFKLEKTTLPEPETPDVPTVPETPDVPTVPETPDVPTVPETPDVPTVPETPDVPTVPETPDVPTVPETPDVPTVPETPVAPELPAVPEGENIISNGGMEQWNGDKPVDWAVFTASNAEIEQSNDAKNGSVAVVVKGGDSSKRLLSKSYFLEAGSYCFVVYVKADGSEYGSCRLGYAVVKNGSVASTDYKYEKSAASVVSAEWYPRFYEIELTADTEISLVIMNHSSGNGASFLVDDVMLIKK